MAKDPLNIITIESSTTPSHERPSLSSRLTRTKEMQAKFERLWLVDPERFNPLRNCMERERLERTWRLLTQFVALSGKQAADIGCGGGVFSRHLRDAGAQVEAIDIAENALKKLEAETCYNIQAKREAMPTTTLPDHSYDIIVCTELIAELPREDYRLFFAELSRLIRPDGHLICSSAIDIYSEGGVERLQELAQTEFDIMDAIVSYHALYLRVKKLFEIPSQFIDGWQNVEMRNKELSRRRSLSLGWYWLNTTFIFIWIWYAIEPLTRPFRKILKNSSKLLLRLEKICHFIWDEAGISHYLFIAKQRPLKKTDPKNIPIEKPKRKEIWE